MYIFVPMISVVIAYALMLIAKTAGAVLVRGTIYAMTFDITDFIVRRRTNVLSTGIRFANFDSQTRSSAFCHCQAFNIRTREEQGDGRTQR